MGQQAHRHDIPLLESGERLLQGGLAPELKPILVDALLDYQPDPDD